MRRVWLLWFFFAVRSAAGNAKDNDGGTALRTARENRRQDIVDALRCHGAFAWLYRAIWKGFALQEEA